MYQESSHGVKKKMVLFEYNQVSFTFIIRRCAHLSSLMAFFFVCLCSYIFSVICRPWSSGPSGFSVSLLPVCTHTHLQRQVPQVLCFVLSHGAYIEHFVLFYSRAVKAPFLSCLLQESGDSVGLRGLKITSGTNL